MSQVVCAYLLSQTELEQLASSYGADAVDPLADYPELEIPFAYSGYVMVVLYALLEETYPDGFGSEVEQLDGFYQKDPPLLLAFHHSKTVEVQEKLEELAKDPERLAEFCEEFYGETFETAGEVMLGAIHFLQTGLRKLSKENCWLLVYVV